MKILKMVNIDKGIWRVCSNHDLDISNEYTKGEIEIFRIAGKKYLRKYEFHKKVFALFEFIFENNREGWKTIDQTRKIVCMLVGHIEILELKYKNYSEIRKIPASISYNALNQKQFEELYKKILDWCCEYFSMSDEDVKNELEGFLT